jgi:hypothetical protein
MVQHSLRTPFEKLSTGLKRFTIQIVITLCVKKTSRRKKKCHQTEQSRKRIKGAGEQTEEHEHTIVLVLPLDSLPGTVLYFPLREEKLSLGGHGE